MEKRILVLMLLVAVFPLTEAQSLTLIRDSIAPEETLQATANLSSILTPLSKTQIELQDSLGKKIPIAPFLLEHPKDDYYIWFDIPSLQEDEYFLHLKDLPYLHDGILTKESLSAPFTVINQPARLSLSPAAVLLDKSKFSLTISNHGIPTALDFVTPSFLTHPYTHAELVSTSRTFTFMVTPEEAEDSTLEITYGSSSYNIPLMLPSSEPPSESKPPKTEQKPFSLVVPSTTISKTLFEDESLEGPIALRNNLKTPLNLLIMMDPSISTIVTATPSLLSVPPQETAEISLSFNANKKAPLGEIEGDIHFVASDMVAEEEVLHIALSIEPRAAPILPAPQTPTSDGSNELPSTQETDSDIFSRINDTLQSTSERPKPGKGSIMLLMVILIIAGFFYALARRKETRESFEKVVRRSQKK